MSDSKCPDCGVELTPASHYYHKYVTRDCERISSLRRQLAELRAAVLEETFCDCHDEYGKRKPNAPCFHCRVREAAEAAKGAKNP